MGEKTAIETAADAAARHAQNRRVARIRRQRGYAWEDTLVKRFNKTGDWRGFRLGSPSVALPDILAINNSSRTLYTIEAKSGTGTTLQVPHEQIDRCLAWVDTFRAYRTRRVILAFKFLSKKRVGVGEYEGRKLREFFKVWDSGTRPEGSCVCTYDGETYAIRDGERHPLALRNHRMPFQKRR